MCNFSFQSGLFLILLFFAVVSDLLVSSGQLDAAWLSCCIVVSRCLIVVCLLILVYIPLVLIALRLGYLSCL